MEIDLLESVEPAEVERAGSSSAANARLNAWVAVTVALLATFMGIYAR
jgi:hypothetical protein